MPSSLEVRPEIWTREEAIGRLRPVLRDLCGEERSLCRVAAERSIFCGGFRRWPAREFDRRFRPFIGTSTHLTRPQMEAFADLWQLSEQLCQGVTLACDAASLSPGACRGWKEFTEADLERFCRELLGRHVTVGVQEEQIAQLCQGPRAATELSLTRTPPPEIG
jgi:hypothetical protein